MTKTPDAMQIRGPVDGRAKEILTPEALAFVADLHRRFDPKRRELLQARQARAERIAAGEHPDFLTETREVREGDWTVAPVPADLADRRVEITGPVERKMMINALNSGAKAFMADFEDSNSPTWANCVDGQVNLVDAVNRTIEFTNPNGKRYALNDEVATLLVRPRGWHLVEKHVLVDGEPVSASLFDFGLYFFHNAKNLVDRGSGPYFYLPKLESHLEARLWNDVFNHAQDVLGVPRGTIKATVLIETILAAFEMDEILHELRDHSAGLNAGRWDYIFSIIKKFRHDTDATLPDRADVTMSVPFMRAYTELLVRTCHKRAAHAMGGMAAFIPSRKDAEVNATALKKVREDKEREANAGFDGTWVAHPDLVPVAKEVFDSVIGDTRSGSEGQDGRSPSVAKPNQVARQRPDVNVKAADLLRFTVPSGRVTEAGLRNNVSVGILYIESWLRGVGAVAIYNLMEDAATAEISRSQVWQWVHRGVQLAEGREVTKDTVRRVVDEEIEKIKDLVGAEAFGAGRFKEARALFEEVALADDYVEFLTLPAYERLD